MFIETVKSALKQAHDCPISSDFDHSTNPAKLGNLREAAVLVGLQNHHADQWQIWLTQRPDTMQNHAGQIAFAGGKRDPIDTNLTATALREAEEEIGLPQNAATIVGQLPIHQTVTGFAVQPIVAILPPDFKPRPEQYEVADVSAAPASALLNLTQFRLEQRYWQDQLRHYYVVPYGPYYIWGATARILFNFATILDNAN